MDIDEIGSGQGLGIDCPLPAPTLMAGDTDIAGVVEGGGEGGREGHWLKCRAAGSAVTGCPRYMACLTLDCAQTNRYASRGLSHALDLIDKSAGTMAAGAARLDQAGAGDITPMFVGLLRGIAMAATHPLGLLGGVTCAAIAADGSGRGMMGGLKGSSDGVGVAGHTISAGPLFGRAADQGTVGAAVAGLTAKAGVGLASCRIRGSGGRAMTGHALGYGAHGVYMAVTAEGRRVAGGARTWAADGMV